MLEISSQQLIEQLHTGSENAAAWVVAIYTQRLLAVARRRMSGRLGRRVDPEDIVQSAFRILFAHMRQGRYKIGGSQHLWKLLVTITLNKARRQARFHRAARRDFLQEQSAPRDAAGLRFPFEPLCDRPGPEDAIQFEEELQSVLESLPPRDRMILMLRLEGRSTEEIAQRTGRAERSVRRVLEQIRSRLAHTARRQNDTSY